MTSTNLLRHTAPKVRPHLPMGIGYVSGHCNLVASGLSDEVCEMPEPIFRGIVSNAGKFADGSRKSYRAAIARPDFDQGRMDAMLTSVAHQGESPMSCAALREAGAMRCPQGRNCLKPDGYPVRNPAELVAWRYVDKKRDVADRVCSQALLDRHFPEGIVFAQDGFWGYEAGSYRKLDLNVEVKQPVMAILAHDATASTIRGLTEFTKTYAGQTGEYFAENAGRYVCLDNGTLDLETLEVVPHSPDHRLQTRLNIPWEPEADCPRFLSFLDQVFEPDADKAEKIRFVQQWMGYLITPDVSQQKMVWLVGEGSNGKSV